MNSFMAIIVRLFLAFILFIGHQQVQATRRLSENEQIGSTLSIRTMNEEIYDCVDFYKQPAFNNPLLHNLTFKIEEKQTRQAPLDIGLKGGGCPFGTVPIARSTKKPKTYLPLQNSNIIPFNETTITPQWDPLEAYRCYAIVRTADSGPVYMGASGDVSIYNPAIDGTQYSASRMRLQSGPDLIEAGWMVSQMFFKDTKTHLYIRFVAGGAKGGPNGCFNLDCPGFVLVGKEVPIGLVPDKISERKKVQYFWRISIDKHKDDGNWWLSIGEQKYEIGYWPNSLFTSLSDDGATRVEWGGEVYLPPDAQGFAGMGCGNRADPEYDIRLTAYYGRTKLVKDDYNVVDPPDNTVKYQNCEKKYTVEDAGNTGNPHFGRLILFGGPHPF